MAKKSTRGLPTEYAEDDQPVELNDFLDEDPTFAPSQPESKERLKVLPGRGEQTSDSPTVPDTEPKRKRGRPKKRPEERKPRKKREVEPPKLQFTCNAETKRQFEEILQVVRDRGPQKNVAASEVMAAMVKSFHRAKQQIDLSHVGKRGQWGSPSARSFVDGISQGLTDALIEREE